MNNNLKNCQHSPFVLHYINILIIIEASDEKKGIIIYKLNCYVRKLISHELFSLAIENILILNGLIIV